MPRTIDEKLYESEVLEPARKAGRPPAFTPRFQITRSMSAKQIVDQVDEVVSWWKRARRKTRFKTLVDRLLAEHARLKPEFDAAREGNLRPLMDRWDADDRERKEKPAQLERELTNMAGYLELLAPGAIARVAKTHGVDVHEVNAAARRGSYEIREPDELPTTPPVRSYARYREAMDVLSHRHLADFVFERRHQQMSVFERFTAPIAKGRQLDRDAVEQARRRWDLEPRDSRSEYAGSVLAVLGQAASDGPPALLELLRYELAEQLRERHGMSDEDLCTVATEKLGVTPQDARRLVFAIKHERHVAGPSAIHRQLAELLDHDQPSAAHELASTFASLPDDATQLAQQASEQVQRANELRGEAAARPSAGHDPAEGDRQWALLTKAQLLAPDLPSLREAMRQLPPAPPFGVDVTISGTNASIRWNASRSRKGDVRYRVIRQLGHEPSSPRDGHEVVDAAAELATLDVEMPVNVTVYYSVVAHRDEVFSSLAHSRPTVLRPEPSHVQLRAGDGVVEATWRCPAPVERVVVLRGESETPTEASGVRVRADRSGFRDREVRNDVTYRYWIAAVYLDSRGREVSTSGTVRSATPVRKPEPVASLGISAHAHDPDHIELRFTPPERGVVEIIELASPPQWPMGTAVPLADVLKAGTSTPGVPSRSGLIVRRPSSLAYLMAVTKAGDTATIGDTAEYVWVAPLTDLGARRVGGEIVLSWRWPADLAEVEAAWDAKGERGTLRTTKATYHAAGGVRVPAAEGSPVELSITPVARLDGTLRRGQPQALTVAGQQRASYRLSSAGPPWRRRLVVSVRADQPARIGRLVLGLRAGPVKPVELGQCEPLGELRDVDVGPDEPAELVVPAPRQNKPYWLRCFATDDAVDLHDPPTDELRRL